MTALGAPIDRVDHDDDAAFDSAGKLAELAERRHGTHVDEVRRIAGLRVRLRITGEVLAAALLPALAHHPRAEPSDGYDVEMRAWDAPSAGGRLPIFSPTALDGGNLGCGPGGGPPPRPAPSPALPTG